MWSAPFSYMPQVRKRTAKKDKPRTPIHTPIHTPRHDISRHDTPGLDLHDIPMHTDKAKSHGVMFLLFVLLGISIYIMYSHWYIDSEISETIHLLYCRNVEPYNMQMLEGISSFLKTVQNVLNRSCIVEEKINLEDLPSTDS